MFFMAIFWKKLVLVYEKWYFFQARRPKKYHFFLRTPISRGGGELFGSVKFFPEGGGIIRGGELFGWGGIIRGGFR